MTRRDRLIQLARRNHDRWARSLEALFTMPAGPAYMKLLRRCRITLKRCHRLRMLAAREPQNQGATFPLVEHAGGR